LLRLRDKFEAVELYTPSDNTPRYAIVACRHFDAVDDKRCVLIFMLESGAVYDMAFMMLAYFAAMRICCLRNVAARLRYVCLRVIFLSLLGTSYVYPFVEYRLYFVQDAEHDATTRHMSHTIIYYLFRHHCYATPPRRFTNRLVYYAAAMSRPVYAILRLCRHTTTPKTQLGYLMPRSTNHATRYDYLRRATMTLRDALRYADDA